MTTMSTYDTEPQLEPALPESAPPPKPHWLLRLLRGLVMYLLPIALVGGAVFGAWKLYQTGPKAVRRPPAKQRVLVEVSSATRQTMPTTVQVMGTVVAAEEIVLQPRVTGEVVRLSRSFVPGGRFEAGAFMLQIDPRDYELAVDRARSQVAEAAYALKLEQGHQEIARREWDLLDLKDDASALDQELALRKPHLAKAKAAVTAAKAALREAELNLERTTIHAPFNGMLVSEGIDLGAQVTPQTQLGKLVGTDAYWVQASVPMDQLRWLRFPKRDGGEGSPATIRQELGYGSAGEWPGHVTRLMADLEPQGRMARVLITVEDPLRGSPETTVDLPLVIGAYVNVAIEGRTLDDVVVLPRTALRDGRHVWLMDEDDALAIRTVSVVWSNRDVAAIGSGLQGGERVVMSDLPAPVEGLALAIADVGEGPSKNTADSMPSTQGEGS